jgi:hypothetical protein
MKDGLAYEATDVMPITRGSSDISLVITLHGEHEFPDVEVQYTDVRYIQYRDYRAWSERKHAAIMDNFRVIDDTMKCNDTGELYG